MTGCWGPRGSPRGGCSESIREPLLIGSHGLRIMPVHSDPSLTFPVHERYQRCLHLVNAQPTTAATVVLILLSPKEDRRARHLLKVTEEAQPEGTEAPLPQRL